MNEALITPSGINIKRNITTLCFNDNLNFLLERLNSEKGVFLSSGTEYPGRYSRWEIGFVNPPVELVAYNGKVEINALNKKGALINEMLLSALKSDDFSTKKSGKNLICKIKSSKKVFTEEERSKQPSSFSVLRKIYDALACNQDEFLGMYGSFGYDLLFEFQPIKLKHKRSDDDKLFHLYLPDCVYVVDRRKETAFCFDYNFAKDGVDTTDVDVNPFKLCDHKIPSEKSIKVETNLSDEEYASMVEKAKESMARGDIFELVLSREFSGIYNKEPSDLYHKITEINPSPYQFMINLGEEYLVGASPEMFVRVNGKRVETCPISGTIKRGYNPIEDANRIKTLLNSDKDEVELTMCTDVDRNDKSRICEAGSVNLLGRRQIETYKGLFHTVDHVEGYLRDEFDMFDAFLSHMWAVTLMGSPKTMASKLIEEMESSSRRWYGGAIGALLFNGSCNTGITIRTVSLKDGHAKYRVGASLVYDSEGFDEANETKTKANSFFSLLGDNSTNAQKPVYQISDCGKGKKVIVIDNEDSFVHTLCNYFRQTGAEVVTFRHGIKPKEIMAHKPDLILHSPGPARPSDFGVPDLVRGLAEYGVAQFGVCLGLQGMVEAFGGSIYQLETPRQGKIWTISHENKGIFTGVPSPAKVGAYHSLTASLDDFPDCLEITARNETGLVMGIKHKTLPISAVQFHPESIMSMEGFAGIKIIENVIKGLI